VEAGVTVQTTTVVAPGELGVAELNRWRELQATDPALDSAFLAPAFAQLVARWRPSVRVAVVEQQGRIVAFFPYERGRYGRARALAAGLSDAQGIIVAHGTQLDVVAMLRACGQRLWEFDHLVLGQGALLAGVPAHVAQDRSQTIDLSEGLESWLATLRSRSGSLVAATARKRRKLEREIGALQFVADAPDHGLLDRLMDLKSDQYRRTGRRDRFTSRSTVGLLHDLLDLRDEDCAGVFSYLAVGDRLVAAHMGLRTRSTLAWWFPVYDPAFSRWSPGMSLVMEIARMADDAGMTSIDLGRGDESFKTRLSNAERPLLAGHVATSRLGSSVERAQHWPAETLTGLVLGSPALRRQAREALVRAGSVRSALVGRRRGASVQARMR
jgi:CelD/BcsL family acetyltransferase involved in cellulose biosynthesis